MQRIGVPRELIDTQLEHGVGDVLIIYPDTANPVEVVEPDLFDAHG
jgi:hypothetical protein